MARPSKAATVLEAEGRSHRTKAELSRRKEAEQAALSGIRLRESQTVKADPVAHKEFRRVLVILSAVGKNDALFESTINDYCTIKSDIVRCNEARDRMERELCDINEADMPPDVKFKLKNDVQKTILAYNRQIAALMKKRFDIEKESGFTISSALRAIPKRPEKEENLLLKALMGDE